MEAQDKVQKLEKMAYNAAEERRDRLAAENDAKVQEALNVSRTSASREAAKICDRELSAAQKEARLIVSSAQNKSQAELINLRASIVEETFAKLTEKLNAFAQSEEYDAFFKARLDDALNAAGRYIGESDARIVIVVSKNDYDKRLRTITEEAERMVVWGRPVVNTAKHDIIGGCVVKIPNMGIVINNSLEAQVSLERENFLSWNGMSVQ